MTGTVILQLVDQVELALDDPVSDYVPDVPNGENITIAQLLDMRSGLHSYSELISFNRILDEEPQKVWQPEALVARGLAEEPQFPPGDGYHYSNTNTVLLGMIIERITGHSARERLSSAAASSSRSVSSRRSCRPSMIPRSRIRTRGDLWGTNESTAVDPALPGDEQEAALAGEIQPNDVTDDSPRGGGPVAGASRPPATSPPMSRR